MHKEYFPQISTREGADPGQPKNESTENRNIIGPSKLEYIDERMASPKKLMGNCYSKATFGSPGGLGDLVVGDHFHPNSSFDFEVEPVGRMEGEEFLGFDAGGGEGYQITMKNSLKSSFLDIKENKSFQEWLVKTGDQLPAYENPDESPNDDQNKSFQEWFVKNNTSNIQTSIMHLKSKDNSFEEWLAVQDKSRSISQPRTPAKGKPSAEAKPPVNFMFLAGESLQEIKNISPKRHLETPATARK